jgi:hypothetical protein
MDPRDDAWYESEESTRLGLIQEVQRIRRRTRARPLPVIAVAALITGALTYKLATRKQQFEAEVVLAIREGSMGAENKSTGLPVAELKELVGSVLMPDARLAELIERRDLHRLRAKLGMPWAINEVREQVSIDVWRNSFVYYDPENPNREASARVGITVADEDPDDAFQLAHDLAVIVIGEVREHRLELATQLAKRAAGMREATAARLTELERVRTEKLMALSVARRDGKAGVAQALNIQLVALDEQHKAVEKTLREIMQSQDLLADRVAAAGLDLIVEIVGERRPPRPESKGLLIAMIAVVVGLGSFLGAALVLGAFDSRVHDVDDVVRLDLPVLGHVPGFPGDDVGSLEARGVQHARVPSFFKWRSRR